MTLREQLRRLVDETGDGPVFVHSDLLTASLLVEEPLHPGEILPYHISLLKEAASGRPLWMPAFNYDFPKTGRFDVRRSPSQVGALSEYFRTAVAQWRTEDPVFSASGIGPRPDPPELGSTTEAFGPCSIFGELDRRRATLLLYGTSIASATISHYCEKQAGGPPYRYDKVFHGAVTRADGSCRSMEYVYHVRPMNRTLEYDCARLAQELRAAGLLREIQVNGRTAAQAIGAHALSLFWTERLRADAFFLLHASTRAWVEPTFHALGRRFLLTDFEPPK